MSTRRAAAGLHWLQSGLLLAILLAQSVTCSRPEPPLSQHGLGTPSRAAAEVAGGTASRAGANELGACQLCRQTVKSFLDTYKQIGRKRVKLGEASWSGDRLLFDASRLDVFAEIQTAVCDDLKVGQDQCRTLFRRQEPHFRRWWNDHQRDQPAPVSDLQRQLCLEQLQVCCPDGHFGPSCRPCPGWPQAVCSGHGRCRGDGTRKGAGRCVCRNGYLGELCAECAPGYYSTAPAAGRPTDVKPPAAKAGHPADAEPAGACLLCDKSCAGSCSGSGPKSCAACRQGYFLDDEYGCLDANECLEQTHPCRPGTFCVNTEGSHLCYECDKACDGCHGDGPDMCMKCAEHHRLENNVCVNRRPTVQDEKMEMSRYATYGGLCLATCIICRNNIVLAAFIGSLVAGYIGLAEYTVGGGSFESTADFLKNFIR